MATASPAEVCFENYPLTVKSGTGKRRAKVYLRAGVTDGDTYNLATSVDSKINAIDMINESAAGAAMVSGSASTWSGTTITFGQTGTAIQEITVQYS